MLTRAEQLGHLAAYGRWAQQHLLEAYFRVAPLHELINEGCDALPVRLMPQPSIRRRRPSFARMARLGRKLGLDVEVARDGVMTLKAGQQADKPETVNPWDEVL